MKKLLFSISIIFFSVFFNLSLADKGKDKLFEKDHIEEMTFFKKWSYYIAILKTNKVKTETNGNHLWKSLLESNSVMCETPGAPVNVTATATGPTTASLDWSPGTPSGSPTVTYYWVVGTSSSVVYGSGIAQGSTTGLWAGATGLTPGTTYYLRVYASTSCNNTYSGYGTSYAFTTSGGYICTTPGAPVNVTATGTGPTTASLDWSPGTPSGSPTVTYYWVVGTIPNVSYNNGVVQGVTTGTWASANGLMPGINYYLRVYAVSSCNNIGSAYGTSNTFTTSGYPGCTTPGAPVNVTATVTGPTTVGLDWSPGTPAGSPTVTYYWVVGTSSSVAYGSGVAQGSTTGLWAGATGLTPGTTYYLRVYASTSCNNTNSGYGTSYAFTTSGYPGCTTPGAPVNVTATATGPTTASLDWSPGTPAGSPTVTYYWVVGTSSSVTYGSGVAQGSTTGLWAGVTGLSQGVTYYLRVYASTNCNNSNSEYGTSYAFSTNCNCITPGSPLNLTATPTGSNTASLDWSPGTPVGTPIVTYYWVVGTSSSVVYGSGVAQGSTTGTWASATGLFPGTTYYLRVFATSDCNNSNSGYSTSYAFITSGYGGCSTPGTPISVTATATGPNTASLEWAAGNPSGSPVVTYYWVLGTSSSVTYGNGVVQGITTGTWAGATGLSPGTTYYLRVFASTSCNNSNSGYGTSYGFTTSGYNGCTTPGAPVNVTATATGPTTASLDWSPGTPAGSPTVTYYWVVGTSSSVTYGNGVAQGSTTGLWAVATGLSPCTIYYLRVFSSSSCNNSISEYGTSYSFYTIGSTICATPGAPVNVTATATGPTTASLDWSPGTPAGSPTVTYYWVVGTSSSVTYGSGVAQGSTAGLWAGATGLTPGTTFYLRVYASTSCNNTNSGYGSSYAFTTSGGYICTTPGTPVNVTATPTSSTTASLDWSPGTPVGSATVRYYWVVGTSSSVTYGNGVAQGSTTGLWAGATGLTAGTTYYLRVYASTSCNNTNSGYGSSYAFTTSGYPGCSTPGTQSSTITFPLVSTQQFTVNWTTGNGSRRVVKINTVNNFTPPANGTDPTANSNYIGYGEQVVYNGNGNSVTVTGLSPNTTYWIRIYEANCNGTSSVYNTNPGSNNPISQQTRTVLPSIQSFAASNVILNGNTIVEINPIFFTNQLYAEHPPIDIFIQGNNKTRFTLNASYAEGFSFQLVDQLTIVTDGTIAINPAVYGQLGPVTSTSVNSMYMDYIHPENVTISPYLSLRIRLLFEGGLVGMSIPVHIHAAQGSLPVDLVDVQAKYDEKKDINELSWITKSEVNNDYFDIERSFENFDFENIGRVEGSGNSNSTIDYVFNDENIQKDGNYTYRLRQVDLNGREIYSKSATVKVSRAQSIKTGIFPNPASELITCYAEVYEGAKVNIEIFNSLGQKVGQNIESGSLNERIISRQIDSKVFGRGIFTVVFDIDGIRYNHKLIIIE